MINRSTDGKQRVLSLSYGKDSLACLGAIEQLGLPLDRIVHAEVWATDTIQADLPPMVEFKAKADAIIKERWGFEVEHFHSSAYGTEKFTYEKGFYRIKGKKSYRAGTITGFPFTGSAAWCNSELKMAAINAALKSTKDCIQYVGIAADEPKRLARLDSVNKISPIALIGWSEADCMEWCANNNLRSPIYDGFIRGGCWFCHNQGIEALRTFRHGYPELWQLLLKWDNDSPVSFKPDGHTVHDFDLRFQLEDDGLIDPKATFRWSMLDDDLQYTIFKD